MSISATTGAQAASVDDRPAVLDAARKPAEASVGRRLWFKEKTYRISGGWAFLIAEMQSADGKPIDYHGTPKAQQADAGFLSKDYAALLRKQDGKWRVVADAVGPTDVIWAGWAQRYGAPVELFRL